MSSIIKDVGDLISYNNYNISNDIFLQNITSL